MSYLHPVRLHFAGSFRADVSTVNNVAARYNNQSFNPNFQKPFSGASDRSNWQPAGTGAWRLLDCRVTRHYRGDGTAASTPADDMVVGLSVREAPDRPSAKIVDLDPQQQGVSMIFGLAVCIVDARGNVLLQGEFEPAAFFDLRSNRSTGGDDAGRSAYFQSVLTDVTWGDISASPCLTQLKRASAARTLSIRFITDHYRTGTQQRGYGRVVGTIGPYFEGEPRTFVLGRHLEVQTSGPPNLEHAQADCRVDVARSKVLVDVGNVLTVGPDGDFSPIGDITLTAGGAALGTLPYQGPGNYASTAGIYELPPDRPLTPAELAAARQQPLQLMSRPPGAAAPSPFASEAPDGIYVRPEDFVFRLDPGASETTDLIVTRFGEPFANATPAPTALAFSNDDTLPLPLLTVDPKTNEAGRARLTITAKDPGNPRRFIDGMVYGIVCPVEESQADPNTMLNVDSNFISVLAFGAATVPDAPGWDDVRPIFKQYADLYPRPHGPDPYAPFDGLPPSHPVVNLDDYDSVAGFAHRIRRALELPLDHPNHMPVTRDLSGAKRRLLLNWLRNLGADGKPRKLRAPAPAATVAAAAPPSGAKRLRVDIARLNHRPASTES